jgi:hypothetical protein
MLVCTAQYKQSRAKCTGFKKVLRLNRLPDRLMSEIAILMSEIES